nr:uncharacterized protein LOC109165784 [Ipomoea batatas]
MCKGFLENGPECLKLRAFYIHLSVSTARKALPQSLTLHYLPRIDGGALEINGSKIRPDAPGRRRLPGNQGGGGLRGCGGIRGGADHPEGGNAAAAAAEVLSGVGRNPGEERN